MAATQALPACVGNAEIDLGARPWGQGKQDRATIAGPRSQPPPLRLGEPDFRFDGHQIHAVQHRSDHPGLWTGFAADR